MEKRKKKQTPKSQKRNRELSLDARKHIIISEIAAGKTFWDVMSHKDEWGISEATMQKLIYSTVEWMRSESTQETLKAMNIQRLDNIYGDAISEKDRKNAIKALDVQNKMIGAYEEKVKIDTDNSIEFFFNI